MNTEQTLPEAELRYFKHADQYALTLGEPLLGVFRAELGAFTPSRVPRRHRAWLLKNEPHRTFHDTGGAADTFLNGVGFLWTLPTRIAWAIAKGIFFAPVYGIVRLVHGKAWEGGWEHAAGRLLMQVLAGRRRSDFNNRSFLLAFTGQRLLVLDEPLSPETSEPFLLAELPRGTYSLRQEPHPARHKSRVDIAFPDGSWLALALRTGSVKHRPEVERLLAS